MKNLIVLFTGIILLHSACAWGARDEGRNSRDDGHSLSIVCAPGLYDLTVAWAEAYERENPFITIEVVLAAGTGIDESPDLNNRLGVVSSEYPLADGMPAWNMLVGRDIMVAIFNPENPLTDRIGRQGIPLEKLGQLLADPSGQHWGTLLNGEEKMPANVYLVDDELVRKGLASMLGIDKMAMEGIRVKSENDFLAAVRKDPWSIGFCRITHIPSPESRVREGQIKLLPIDRNNNGKLDYMEQIYDDLDVMARGVWIGKYPWDLVNNIYFISSAQPAGEPETSFLRWVLTDGQQFLADYGYGQLLSHERQKKLDAFIDHTSGIAPPEESFAASHRLLLILIFSGAVFFILIADNLRRISVTMKREDDADMAYATIPVMDEHVVDIPKGLFYDKTHTWAYMETEGSVRIGIDDFLQHVTGPVTRVKLRSAGEKLRKGKPALSIIQKGKQLTIRAPVSGIIREQNGLLRDNPSLLNSSPYVDGWVYMIEPTNWVTENQFLAMWEKYGEWLKSEFSRLKDFLAASVSPNAEYAHILQDGGEIKDGILEDLGPEVWEDFQTQFIDESI